MCAFQVFFWLNVIYIILIDFEVCINVLLIFISSIRYFRDRLNMMPYDFDGEKLYPENADPSTRDDIMSCKYFCLLF